MSDHATGRGDERIEIRDDGSVAATTAARARLAEACGVWRPLSEGGDLLVFTRAGGGSAAPRGIHFLGAIDGSESLLGGLHFLAMGQESGALYVESHGAQRILYLHRGKLLSARSSRPQDRLGQILLAEKLVTSEQIEECFSESGGSDLLGRALLRQGYLNNHQIYDALRRQTQEIFASMMTVERGVYYLVKPLDMTEVPAMLHLDIQELLFEGLRRSDELKHLRSIVPSDDIALEPTGAERAGELSDDASKLLGELDGRKALSDHFDTLDMDVLVGVKAAAELIEQGLAAEASPERSEPAPPPEDPAERRARSVASPYEKAMQVVLAAVSSDDESARRDLVRLFVASTNAYADLLRDIDISADGALDTDTLIERATALGDVGIALLRRCLHELLFFLLFEVGQRGEHELLDRLHREIADILAQGAPPYANGSG